MKMKRKLLVSHQERIADVISAASLLLMMRITSSVYVIPLKAREKKSSEVCLFLQKSMNHAVIV